MTTAEDVKPFLEVSHLHVSEDGSAIHLGASGLATVTGSLEALGRAGFAPSWDRQVEGDYLGVAVFDVGNAVDPAAKAPYFDQRSGLRYAAGDQWVPLPERVNSPVFPSGSPKTRDVVATVKAAARRHQASDKAERAQKDEDEKALRRERANRAAKRRIRQEESAEAHNQREPLSILNGAALRDLEEPEPDNIIESVLAADSSLILSAPPKVGKTVLVHDMCASLTTGTPLFDTQAVAAIPAGAQVVIVDTELPRANARRRMGEAQPNWDHVTLVSAENHLDQLDVTQAEVRRQWVDTLRNLNAWVVIIDTLGPLVSDSGLDANTEGHRMVLAWKQTVNEAGGRGTIFVDHSNPNHTEVRGPRGDSQKVNYVGGFLHLRPAGDFTMDDELPTEYIISGHTRAGDLYLDLNRNGAHFTADHDGVSRTKVDPVERDAYDYGPRILRYAEELREEQAKVNEDRDPDDPKNYPSERTLVQRCLSRMGDQTRYGRDRWKKIVEHLMGLGALEDVHPTGAQTRLRPNEARYIPDPSGSVMTPNRRTQGTPLTMDREAIQARVFGPRPLPVTDGDTESEAEATLEDVVVTEDTPAGIE